MMTNDLIFDLLYSKFHEKFEGDEMWCYVVGNQHIRWHFLKDENKIDVIECPDFLSKLQEKYAVDKDWSPSYFHCFETGNKISVYQFENENLEEIRTYKNFCSLVIS